MKRTLFLLALLIVLGVSPASVCQGANRNQYIVIKDSKGKQMVFYRGSYALLIGVDDYAELPDLPSVKKKMVKIDRALSENGFKVRRILNPTSRGLSHYIRRFIKDHGFEEYNRLLFFFLGHSYTIKDSRKGLVGYFLPADCPNPEKNRKDFLLSSLDMNDLIRESYFVKSNHVIFLFDSCFSFRGTTWGNAGLPGSSRISSYTFKPVRQFIVAGSWGEQCSASKAFVGSFIDGLKGRADHDRDFFITGTELSRYMRVRTEMYSEGRQKLWYGKMNDPMFDEGEFVFKVVAPQPHFN